MAIVYYVNKLEKDFLKQGINLSNSWDQKVIFDGKELACIKCLLTPKDEDLRYKSKEHQILELEIEFENAYVVNEDLNFLYEKEYYYDSIVKLKDYKFADYRNPRVLVIQDVSCEKISIYEERKGNPLIFENSNDLYKINVMEQFRTIYNDFDETMLAVFFRLMARKGLFSLLEKRVLENLKTLYVYKDNNTNKIYSVSIKEGSRNEQY